MKKFLFISIFALLSISVFPQVAVSGIGTPANPYLLTWTIRSAVDTVIVLPINPISRNYVISINIHYWLNSYATAKFIPVEGPNGKDSLNQYMAFDTTKCFLTTGPHGYRNLIFSSQYTSANVISLRWVHGSVSKGTAWIRVICKPTL